jgi:hypothetical protein
MREHGLQPKRRSRFVATADSNHESPIFPDLARDKIVEGPNQVWVADITYTAITTGFVYMAAILGAWSRRVVGYLCLRCGWICTSAKGRARNSRGPATALSEDHTAISIGPIEVPNSAGSIN